MDDFNFGKIRKYTFSLRITSKFLLFLLPLLIGSHPLLVGICFNRAYSFFQFGEEYYWITDKGSWGYSWLYAQK